MLRLPITVREQWSDYKTTQNGKRKGDAYNSGDDAKGMEEMRNVRASMLRVVFFPPNEVSEQQ